MDQVWIDKEHTITQLRQTLLERKSAKQQYEERRKKLARAWSVTLKKLRKKYGIKHDRGMRVESQLDEVNYPSWMRSEIKTKEMHHFDSIMSLISSGLPSGYDLSLDFGNAPTWSSEVVVRVENDAGQIFSTALLNFFKKEFRIYTTRMGKDAQEFKRILSTLLLKTGWVKSRSRK